MRAYGRGEDEILKELFPNKSFVICIGETKLKRAIESTTHWIKASEFTTTPTRKFDSIIDWGTHSFTSRVILFIRILSSKMFESCFREQAHFSFVEFPLTLHSAKKVNSVAISHGMSWDAGQCAFFSRSPVHPSDCRYSGCLGVSHTWSGVYRSPLYSSGWKPSSVGICILRISPC